MIIHILRFWRYRPPGSKTPESDGYFSYFGPYLVKKNLIFFLQEIRFKKISYYVVIYLPHGNL